MLEEVLIAFARGLQPDSLRAHLERLLARSAGGGEIDCFAAAAGPGSFTGVRVGLAAAKGLAEASESRWWRSRICRPWRGSEPAPLRAVMLDARRGEIYGAVYDAALEAVSPEVVAKFPAWLVPLPEGEIEFLLDEPAPSATRWPARGSRTPLVEAPRALAGAIGRIACGAAGGRPRAQDPAAIDANYVRRSDAELFWKDAG